MAGDAIASNDQNLQATGMRKRDRGTVGFARFFMRFARADVLPDFLAGFRGQRQEVGIIRAVFLPPTVDRYVALEDLDK